MAGFYSATRLHYAAAHLAYFCTGAYTSGEITINGRSVHIECYLRGDGRQVVKVGDSAGIAEIDQAAGRLDFRAELKAELERVRNRRRKVDAAK